MHVTAVRTAPERSFTRKMANKLIRKPTAIDLFCGCGGMGLGLEQAGFEVLYANDISKDATYTYRTNLHADMVECKDVTRVDMHKLRARIDRPVDIIVAGTPCQGFSMLGKRDPDDPRNAMFKHLARFLAVFQPKAFIMENVAGMLSMRNGLDFAKICEKLKVSDTPSLPQGFPPRSTGFPKTGYGCS